jgi:hypothetical protein
VQLPNRCLVRQVDVQENQVGFQFLGALNPRDKVTNKPLPNRSIEEAAGCVIARLRVIGTDPDRCDRQLRVCAMPDDISPTREIAQASQHHRQPKRRRSSTHTGHRTNRHIHTHPKHNSQGRRARPALGLALAQLLVADMVEKQR